MQEMWIEAVSIEPNSLACVPDRFQTQEMYVACNPYTLRFIPDHLKMQEMCNEVIRINPAACFDIPDRFETVSLKLFDLIGPTNPF